MKNLFLTSSFADSYQQLPESLTGKNIAFFDTASLVEEHTEFKDEALTILSDLGGIVTIINLQTDSFKEEIATADIIFVAGGNTFYLLQELRRSGADELILEHINQGKLYIGESAGSIIMGPDIEYIKYMDEPEKAPLLENTTGLHVIDVYPLPHVENEYLDDAVKKIAELYQNQLPLHPLTDLEVLLIVET